jgi:hypothetical protein
MEWFRAQVDRETMLEWLVAWEEVDASWRAKDEPANLASPIDLEGPLRQKTCPFVGYWGTENQVQNVLLPYPDERRLNRAHDDTSTANIVQTERAYSETHAIHRSCLDVGKRNLGIRCANSR